MTLMVLFPMYQIRSQRCYRALMLQGILPKVVGISESKGPFAFGDFDPAAEHVRSSMDPARRSRGKHGKASVYNLATECSI